MQKRDFKSLALLGLTTGLLLMQQGAKAGPAEYMNGQDLLAMMADHQCKGKNGCSAMYQACNNKSSCQYMEDHSKCKAKGGCGGLYFNHGCSGSKNGCSTLTAERDQPNGTTSPFQSPATDAKQKKSDANDGNLGYHLLTEKELMLELNAEGIKMYNSLTPEGKATVLRVASARCGNSNECAGLNACQTAKNECAGKGSCKGQGKCALADKNLAVKIVYNKLMKEKRSRAMNE